MEVNEMGRFLDMRISENSSLTGSPNTPLTTTPALAGVIGLQTQGVAGTGTNGLIVHLHGTVGVAATVAAVATVTVNVQRGSAVFGGGTIIYTADFQFGAVGTPVLQSSLVNFTAVDINAPAAAETVYAMFVSATTLVGTLVRSGPESFNGIAQNGLAPTP
jgi:hypothetical protein